MKLNRLLKIILVIFLFCIYSFTNAQTLTVYKFEEDKTDLEAYLNEVKDVNGEKCALIKVFINNIPIEQIRFDTKGIEFKKIEYKPPTQIWIYAPPQTLGIIISTTGYGNLKYYEFPTGPLKSTKTYIMELRTDIKLKLVEEKINPEFVKIKTDPAEDVEVFIDNVKKGITPLKPPQIAPGKHNIKLIKSLYHNLDTNVLVKINTDNDFIFKLKPKFGQLIIKSKGEFNDAKMYLDEEEKCRTPCTIEVVRSGNHRIIIKKDLYADYNENFEMTDGGIKEIELTALNMKPIYATINLRTNPTNAEIYINKEKLSSNGILTNYKASSGSYFIEAKLKKYKDFQKNVILKEQENFTETIQLEPQIGDISIETNPIDCDIYLNGVKQNRLTPAVLRNIQVGSYQLELKKEGFTSIKKQIEIKDGETTKIFEKLIAGITIPIITEPSNASIEIDGIYLGISPISYKFTIGKNYNIKITKENYKQINETIFITENVYKLPVYNLEKLEKILPIITEPTNATIEIDGKYIGISPISYKFTIGKNYNIKITKENYKPINETIFITENTNKLPVYNLEKLEKILPIITEPSNARIYIDDNYIGISPISYKFTIGKNYNIKITKENYKPINETIFITENVNKLPVYNLEKDIVLPKIEMVFVQGGTFTMGCTDEQGSDCYDKEKPAHQVTLSDYYIGKYEVTQGLWKKVMGNNPSRFINCGDDCPVESVSWNDCQEFISKLNQLTGKRFRLPTEAEWEYAARGGSKASYQTKYAGSNALGEVAWYNQNSDVNYSGGYEYKGRKLGTHTVGTKKPNALGIYDMSGNVWEWCNDWFGDYSSGGVMNPKGASTGSNRVIRGGSWGYYGYYGYFNRVSYRDDENPRNSGPNIGIRLVFSSY